MGWKGMRGREGYAVLKLTLKVLLSWICIAYHCMIDYIGLIRRLPVSSTRTSTFS